ncbi:MAG: YdhR family protein, partial [Pelovirga sp.]
LEEARQAFVASAPNYRNQPGLVRKQYLLSEDGKTAGGIYCWTSRQDAEALFTDSWKELVRGKYGADPSLAYFDNPVTVDNLTDEISA